MVRAIRWIGYVFALILFISLTGAIVIWAMSARKLGHHETPRPERLTQASVQDLADAPRRLLSLGCVHCHGDGLLGKVVFDNPVIARTFAPNLTLLAERASDQQLAAAIRQGIGVDGRPLIAMRSAAYSRLTDSEVAALIAAIRNLPRGGSPMPPSQSGPVGRLALATGQMKTQPMRVAEYAAKAAPDAGPAFATGRHLAEIHCSECHGADFSGAEPEPGAIAPDLTIAAAYDLPDFLKLLRTGVPPGGRKLRQMDQIARLELSYLTDQEAKAIHAYMVEHARLGVPPAKP